MEAETDDRQVEPSWISKVKAVPSRLHIHIANRRSRSDELSVRHGGEQTAPCSSLGWQDVGF